MIATSVAATHHSLYINVVGKSLVSKQSGQLDSLRKPRRVCKQRNSKQSTKKFRKPEMTAPNGAMTSPFWVRPTPLAPNYFSFQSTVWVKKPPPPWNYLTFFPKRLGIFSPNFMRISCVPIYDGLQIFIQLSSTLTKLWLTKRDHHNLLKMSTIDRYARWVVALNMA